MKKSRTEQSRAEQRRAGRSGDEGDGDKFTEE